MEDLLEKISKSNQHLVEEAKKNVSFEEMRSRAEHAALTTGFPFEAVLKEKEISLICECKKASPSRGLLAQDYPYVDIAMEYEEAGAAAVAVVTEPKWYRGNIQHLKEVAEAVHIPVLRKDVIVDEYMIYESRAAGADAVSITASILDDETLKRFIALCDRLGMTALVEVHDKEGIDRAVRAGARAIGVNNRNLRDFSINVQRSIDLKKQAPEDILFVAESGIGTAMDVRRLRASGVSGALIGESLMKSSYKKYMLNRLKSDVRVKISGITDSEEITAINRLKPDYIDFIFTLSSRKYITPMKAKELKELLDPDIRTVGLFLNEDPTTIGRIAESGSIDLIQLSGSESELYIHDVKEFTGKPVIREVRVTSDDEILRAADSVADLLLFDHRIQGTPGTRRAFRWDALRANRANIHKPFFVGGGIYPETVRDAITWLEPYGLDAGTSLDTGGLKDPAKMEALIRAVRETV
ncbi:MAG: indole-3-glycerol phosphate synthase TrpC [Anaerovoracaceae bacterium]|jgi:indole-3-glycerol phosphate synthase/phosphoribosylanthranilate isomerase